MNHRLPPLPPTRGRLFLRVKASLRARASLRAKASRPGRVSRPPRVSLQRKVSRLGKVSLRRRARLRVRASRLGKVSRRAGASLPRTAGLRRTVSPPRKVSRRPRAKLPRKVNRPRTSPAPARGKGCRRSPVPHPLSALVGAYRLAARHVMSAEIGGTTVAAGCPEQGGRAAPPEVGRWRRRAVGRRPTRCCDSALRRLFRRRCRQRGLPARVRRRPLKRQSSGAGPVGSSLRRKRSPAGSDGISMHRCLLRWVAPRVRHGVVVNDSFVGLWLRWRCSTVIESWISGDAGERRRRTRVAAWTSPWHRSVRPIPAGDFSCHRDLRTRADRDSTIARLRIATKRCAGFAAAPGGPVSGGVRGRARLWRTSPDRPRRR